MSQNGVVDSNLNQFSYYRSHSGKGPPTCKEFKICGVNRILKWKITCLISSLSFLVFLLFLESVRILVPILTIGLSGLLAFDLLWAVKSETLLMTVPVGLQLTTTYVLGQESILFIPWDCLEDIIIIEVITGQQVLYYLAATLSGERSHVILFKNTRPRLRSLENIYKETRCLFQLSI